MNDNKRFTNWSKFIDPRINRLVENNFFLEAFYICFATVEFLLQTNIRTQEEWIQRCLRKRGVKFDLTPEDKLQTKPLGDLIKIFSRYCENNDLISRLNDLNSFRKTTVHRLMDQDVEKLNLTARSKLKEYHELIAKLSRYGLKISNKKIESFSREIRSLKNNRPRRVNSVL